MSLHAYCVFFASFSTAGLLKKCIKKGNYCILFFFVITGGDRQGCRQAELYSLMGEEHRVAHRQSNGQSGGKSICLTTHYILLYHSVYTRVVTILTNTAESR